MSYVAPGTLVNQSIKQAPVEEPPYLPSRFFADQSAELVLGHVRQFVQAARLERQRLGDLFGDTGHGAEHVLRNLAECLGHGRGRGEGRVHRRCRCRRRRGCSAAGHCLLKSDLHGANRIGFRRGFLELEEDRRRLVRR